MNVLITPKFKKAYDKFYRMTFYKNEEIVLQLVGPHDEGLGKK